MSGPSLPGQPICNRPVVAVFVKRGELIVSIVASGFFVVIVSDGYDGIMPAVIWLSFAAMKIFFKA